MNNPIYKFGITETNNIDSNIFPCSTFTIQTCFTEIMNEFCIMQFVRHQLSLFLIKNNVKDYDLDYQFFYNEFHNDDQELMFKVELLDMVDQLDTWHFDISDPLSFIGEILVHTPDNLEGNFTNLECTIRNIPIQSATDYDASVRIPLACEYDSTNKVVKRISPSYKDDHSISYLFDNPIVIKALNSKLMDLIFTISKSSIGYGVLSLNEVI